MGNYEVLKAIHVLAAVIWVGGGFTLNLLATRAVWSGDGPRMAGFGRDAAWIGQAVYLPASVVVLIFGVLAVLEADLSFGEPWIGIGFAGIVVTAITGSAVLGPEAKRVAALAEQEGPNDAEVKRRVARLVALGRIDLVILLVVVVVMVVKPGA